MSLKATYLSCIKLLLRQECSTKVKHTLNAIQECLHDVFSRSIEVSFNYFSNMPSAISMVQIFFRINIDDASIKK